MSEASTCPAGTVGGDTHLGQHRDGTKVRAHGQGLLVGDDDPRLATHLGEDPAEGGGQEGKRQVEEREAAQPLVGRGPTAAGGPQTPRSQQEGHHAQADHESEGPEGHHLRGTEVELRGITVLGGEIRIRVEQRHHALLDIRDALGGSGEGVV